MFAYNAQVRKAVWGRTECDVFVLALLLSGAVQQPAVCGSIVRWKVQCCLRPLEVVANMQYVKDTVDKYWTAATWDKRSMRDLQGWTIVVIGATDGVGYESAKAFAEHNAHVVLVGRNEEKSQK